MSQDARFAAIDLGSNSFHVIIAEAKRDGGYRILKRYRQKVRLADGFNADLHVSEQAIQRGLNCLSHFATLLQDIPDTHIRCVATATLRKAKNRDQILPRFQSALRQPIEIISGDCEAKLIYQGATLGVHQADVPLLVLDIGGASTEVIVGKGTQPSYLNSYDMGCVVWQNRFFPNQQIDADACAQAIKAAEQAVSDNVQLYQSHTWHSVRGASGTFRALYDILERDSKNSRITSEWLQKVIAQAIELAHVKKLGQLNIRRDRQPVFMGGVCILMGLMNQLNIEEIELADGALREGLLTNVLAATNQL